MNFVRVAMLMAAVGFLLGTGGGCAVVSSAGVVGDRPYGIDAEAVAGTWVSAVRSDGARGTITVLDAAAGTFRLEWKPDPEKAETLTMDGWTRQVEGSEWLLVTLAWKVDDVVRHVWGRVSLKTEDAIVFWAPDVEKFRALVASGAWKGAMKNENDISLAEFTAEQLKALTSESQGVLYDWDQPGVYVRE